MISVDVYYFKDAALYSGCGINGKIVWAQVTSVSIVITWRYCSLPL